MNAVAARIPRLSPEEALRSRATRSPVSGEARRAAERIIQGVREQGEPAIRELAERFGERAPGDPLVLSRRDMDAALDRISADDRAVLERSAARIRAFAEAQRAAIQEVDIPVPGGRAGHTIEPVESAGCYAPGGRYPLPSSALMTAVTARAAGVDRVAVASPGAPDILLAAAAIAGADEFLAIGGAHAVAALAFGAPGLDPVDTIVGPGNAYVTAAKQLVAGTVGIDMLAGPSELLVIADAAADPTLVAADLLAQAEHDREAAAMLITTNARLASAVEQEIERQLPALETRETALVALANGFICVVDSLERAAEIASAVAPEHLEILTERPRDVAAMVGSAGAVFLGHRSAEVLGDYGAGPNHTLPTGGAARFGAGLSVMHFLRLRTYLELNETDDQLLADTAALARIEGLAAHAAAAQRRRNA